MYLKYQNFYLTIIFLIFFALLIFINTAQAKNLIFTEIMYDPEGSDNDQEWLEIFNFSTSTIEINSDWRFNDGSNHLLNLYQGNNQIATSSFFIITADAENFLNNYPDFDQTIFESSLNLNNTSDILQLLNNDTLINEITYISDWGANGNNKTLEKIDIYNPQSNWQESYILHGTPGAESSSPPPNQAPIAIAGDDINGYVNEEITFDANASYDPDGDQLNFFWDLAGLTSSTDAVTTYQFSQIGTYTITLIINDNQASSTDSLTIIIEEEINPPIIIDNIIINELLPNPEGSDDYEWIELKNENENIISLENFYLEDNSDKKYIFSLNDFPNLDINDYFVLERSVSGISLNNFDEIISLFNNAGEKIDEFSYSESRENYSWSRFDNEWKQTSLLTKGEKNQEETYQSPIAVIDLLSEKMNINQEITLSSENSNDPQNSNLESKWYIDNSFKSNEEEIKITFSNSGLKKIKLKIINEYELENETTVYLYINDAENEQLEKNQESFSEECLNFNQKIIINEILPNPEGSDSQEWIELYNPNNHNINLNNWTLKDKTSSFDLNQTITAEGYSLIEREKSQIALNNSNEELQLLDCQQNLIWELSYTQSWEGQSYTYDQTNEEYFWSDNLSPNQKNILSSTENNIPLEKTFLISENEINFVEISEIPNLEKNKEVLISGIIISLPHEIYKNTAHICYYDPAYKLFDFQECTALYFNQEWPLLNYGDLIQIQGKIDHLKNYSRLKIKNPEDIIIIKKQIPFDLNSYYIEELEEEMINSFISTSGQISKLNKKSFYIMEEENELKIKINNDQIELNKFSKNDSLKINGLLTLYSDNLVLIPRNKKDLIESDVLEKTKNNIDNKNNNLISTSTELIDLNTEKKETKTTDWILGSGIITTLGFVFKNKIIGLFKK